MRPADGVVRTVGKALRIDRAVRLVFRCAPGWTLVGIVLVVVQGVLPLAALYLTKRVVDAVAAGFASMDKSRALADVFFWIGAAAGVALLAAACRSLADLASEAQAQAVTDEVADIVHAKSIAVDLGYYEDPGNLDTLHRAQQEAPYRPARIVGGLIQVGQGAIAAAGIAVLLFSFNRAAGLVLIAAAIPGAVVRFSHSRRVHRFEEGQAEPERRAGYYHWLLTDAGHAKEVRLFGLGPHFRERFRDLRSRLREGRLSLSRKRALSDLPAQAFATAAVFAAFALICREAIVGAISLGAVVMYFQGYLGGLGHVQSVLRGLAGLYEDNLFLDDFHRFLDVRPAIGAPRDPAPVPEPIRQGIVFEGVRFSYPGCASEALSGVDLVLPPGEVIALVGENGSGKTTLVKLLCRLYDPAQGRIAVDGTDLRRLDPQAWRRQIGVAFQDHVQYSLSAAENIGMGRAHSPAERERVARAAQVAGADSVVARLPSGYDTILGNRFEGGHELSAGEWQTIALARAFFRDAPVVVLDEPTSALDPLAEEALFARFRTLVAGRTALLVSHRFSTVRMADRIYVLDRGRVAEQGSHPELLAQDGRYARLYRAQAQRYGEDIAGSRP